RWGGDRTEAWWNGRVPVCQVHAGSARDGAGVPVDTDDPQDGLAVRSVGEPRDSAGAIRGIVGPFPLKLNARVLRLLPPSEGIQNPEHPGFDLEWSHDES